MALNYTCPSCGGIHFRIYYSRNLAQCDKCLKEYKLSELKQETVIKHQR